MQYVLAKEQLLITIQRNTKHSNRKKGRYILGKFAGSRHKTKTQDKPKYNENTKHANRKKVLTSSGRLQDRGIKTKTQDKPQKTKQGGTRSPVYCSDGTQGNRQYKQAFAQLHRASRPITPTVVTPRAPTKSATAGGMVQPPLGAHTLNPPPAHAHSQLPHL